tara:strand:- start:149 stop:706 length:558 start_codon:yes stop_codon:yes gene_type:complete
MVLVQPRNAQQGFERSPAGFPPTTSLNAAVPLYGGLGAPKANRANPAAGGNAENNWWTPSYVLDTDCEGNKVTPTNKLSQECINKKKVRPSSHGATHSLCTAGPPLFRSLSLSLSLCTAGPLTASGGTRLQVAELKSRQDLNSLNGQYKVEKLERIKQSQLDKAAQKAAQDAEVKARQAKYANRR